MQSRDLTACSYVTTVYVVVDHPSRLAEYKRDA